MVGLHFFYNSHNPSSYTSFGNEAYRTYRRDDRPNRPTDWRTDWAIGKFHFHLHRVVQKKRDWQSNYFTYDKTKAKNICLFKHLGHTYVMSMPLCHTSLKYPMYPVPHPVYALCHASLKYPMYAPVHQPKVSYVRPCATPTQSNLRTPL